jgi:hypothetical protein
VVGFRAASCYGHAPSGSRTFVKGFTSSHTLGRDTVAVRD